MGDTSDFSPFEKLAQKMKTLTCKSAVAIQNSSQGLVKSGSPRYTNFIVLYLYVTILLKREITELLSSSFD